MVTNQEFGGLGVADDDIIQAVIFDMDGVLIDSEPIYFEIERSSFAHFGAVMTEEEHHTYVGVTLESMWLTSIGQTSADRYAGRNICLSSA